MKYLALSALILFSAICIGQVNVKLDNRYGLKIFKLKSSPNDYKGKLIKVSSPMDTKQLETYEYTGGDVTMVSGIAIESIQLTFFESQLMSVHILFMSNHFGKKEYSIMLRELQYIYGDGYEREDLDLEGVTNSGSRIWKGQKTELNISLYESDKNNASIGSLMMIETALSKKLYESEF